jgi:hypothetical protein
MWPATSVPHTGFMHSNWYQTPTLVAEHRASLEKAASRRRVRRSYRLWRREGRSG